MSARRRTLSADDQVGTATERRRGTVMSSVTQFPSGQRNEDVLQSDLAVGRLADFRVVAMRRNQSRGRAYRQYLAVIHDGNAITNCLRLLHRVCREKNAAPLLAKALDPVPQLAPALRVEPRRGLVEQHQGGIMDGREQQRESLLLTPR